ncbi:MAG: helix-turn-helix transcriptional regulator [Bacteroidales bacterium]|nr:helix-turn-helix transcriptional regulator [Bacteroidales bacterium]
MNTRLQQFLAAENISQSQFADVIGVARASVSHILAGRNKPGFDFIESMMRHYPSLNIEWLIAGSGKMYKTKEAPTRKPDDDNLFPEFDNDVPMVETEANSQISETSEEPLDAAPQPQEVKSQTIAQPEAPQIPQVQSKAERKIKKVIVLYDDNTFGELG